SRDPISSGADLPCAAKMDERLGCSPVWVSRHKPCLLRPAGGRDLGSERLATRDCPFGEWCVRLSGPQRAARGYLHGLYANRRGGNGQRERQDRSGPAGLPSAKERVER